MLRFAGAQFRSLVDDYLRKALRKGVPPIFVDLQPLYKDPAKRAAIEDLCLGYLKNLKAHCSFDAEASEVHEPVSALLWLLYYLGQHYDFLQQHDRALETVNEAIEHTPTLIELFLLKAKIYKVRGGENTCMYKEEIGWLKAKKYMVP